MKILLKEHSQIIKLAYIISIIALFFPSFAQGLSYSESLHGQARGSVLGANTVTFRSLLSGNQKASWIVSGLTLSTYRAEFRLENIQQSSVDRYVYSDGDYPNISCVIRANGLILQCMFDNDGAGQGTWSYTMTAGQDLRVRYQRDANAAVGTLEAWNGDCSQYSKLQRPITYVSPPFTWNGPMNISPNLQLAFLRLYSSLDSNADCPFDAPSGSADLVDFRFENDSLIDSSSHGYKLTSPSASFINSLVYQPIANISGWTTYKPVFSAGVPFSLSGVNSLSTSGNIESYSWSQISGPNTASISNPTAPIAMITSPAGTFGQYVFRLTIVTSDGRTGYTDQAVGVVNADSKGVVTPPGELGGVLGPVLMHGQSPWPWYDATEAADADALAVPYQATLSETMLPGTVSVLTGANNYNGTASDWKGNTIAVAGYRPYTGIVLTGDNSTNFSSDLQGKFLYLHWDADGDGSMQGRAAVYISQVINSHALVTGNYSWPVPLGKSTGMGIGQAGPEFAYYNAGNQGVTPWNYYEALLGVYRLYYRTGLTQYLNQARAFCNTWWRYALNSGYNGVIPRNSGWLSMIACAADNHPEWWPGIAYTVGLSATSISGSNVPVGDDEAWNKYDVREASYILRASAVLAKYVASHAANAASEQKLWCTTLTNQLQNFWLPRQEAEGYWQENPVYWNINSPMGKMNGKWGTAPWRGVGLGVLALIQSYQSLSGDSPCKNPNIAAQLFTGGINPTGAIPKAVRFLWDYGRTSDSGIYANVLYASKGYGGGDVGSEIKNPSQMPAGSKASVDNGSSTVVGSGGTQFLSTFAPCDGTTYIGLFGNTNNENDVYRVVSCTDDTHLTINRPYDHTSVSNVGYSKSKAAMSNCSPSVAASCEPDWYDNRNLSADVSASAAWLYAQTGNATWKDYAQFYQGKVFGGPAGGSGSLGSPVGPYADGRTGNLGEILPPCQTVAAPCGNGYLYSKAGKPFGMAAGAGDVPVALAEIASVLPLTPIDTTPPVIADISTGALTSNSAVITWSTNKLADDQVEYDTGTSYQNSSALGSTFKLGHSVNLSGLMPATLYHYRTKSRDGGGNLAVSPDRVFTTLSVSPTSSPISTPTPTPIPTPTPPNPIQTPAFSSPPVVNQTPIPSSSFLNNPPTPPAPAMVVPPTQPTLPLFRVGDLVNDSGTIYYIAPSQTKIPFTNLKAFKGLGYSIRNVKKGDASGYRISQVFILSNPNQGHPWGSWLKQGKAIYYSTEQGFIPVPSMAIFTSNGATLKDVLPMSKAEIKNLKTHRLSKMEEKDKRVAR